MEVIADQFNNREIATAVWLTVFFTWALSHQPLRKAIPSLLRAAFNKTIIATFILMVVYIALMVYGLERIGIWNSTSHLKDTIIWSLTVATAMTISVNSALQKKGFFKKAIKDAIKFTILLEFIVGFYPFSLPVELILIPILALLGGMMGVASMKAEYARAKKLLVWPIGFLGFLTLWHSVSNMVVDAESFISLIHLAEMVMPSLLTILFLPFIYLLALFIMYDLIFMRLEHRNKNPELTGYMKRKILLRFGFNLRKLIRWSGQNPDLKVNSKDEISNLIGRTIEPIQTASSATSE